MLIFKTVSGLQKKLNKLKSQGKTIGFVPTMGALHNGHISLLNLAKKEFDISVCSVFVNPTQFNDSSDLEKYPRTLTEDIRLLTNNQNDILFIPDVKEIYPEDEDMTPKFDLGDLATVLEGEFRPGHFDGVVQVVHRLLEIVKPDAIIMGQKDFQQAAIIKKMLKLANLDTKLVVAPIIRTNSGLAMSSRNKRLSTEALLLAPNIHKTLNFFKDNYFTLNEKELRNKSLKILGDKFDLEYLSVVDADTLQKVDSSLKSKAVVLIAAWLDGVRLIDNMIID